MKRRYLVLFLLGLLIGIAGGASAGYRETFEREFLSKPWGAQEIEEDVCIDCHASDKMKPKLQGIVDEWRMSWHAENDVSCQHCHGGDPRDASLSMSPQRGFLGTPKYADVPDFCGRCHVGILKSYLESGHGKTLRPSGKGPNCVTCHGAHNIQKASVDIISEQRCARCHSYERAKVMKQALFVVEKKMAEIQMNLAALRRAGIFTGEEEKLLFRTQAEFRTIFHTTDVSLVKEKTDEFARRLDKFEAKVKDVFHETRFRSNFSAFLMLVFLGMAVLIVLIAKTKDE